MPTLRRFCGTPWSSSAQALSPVGRCKSFDAGGDGYGRGEGFTIALLRCEPGQKAGSSRLLARLLRRTCLFVCAGPLFPDSLALDMT